MNERLHQELVAIDGVEEAPSRHQDGPALWLNGATGGGTGPRVRSSGSVG